MDVVPHIVVGTYEEFVLGYKPTALQNEERGLKLSQIFASHSHQASIRCIATHGRWLVSSGADEYINIYDMTTMKLSFVLNYHSSTVTCLEFVPDGSHLVTATQDGTIAIFRSCDWILAKVWRDAHKTANGVTSISVHPSGGLMISTGADNVIKFWNLIKGRVAYVKNFSSKCSPGNTLNMAKWSKNGTHYAVCIGKKVEVYCTETANVTHEFEAPAKVSCIDFTESGLLCLGTDEGLVELHKFEEKKLIYKNSCHELRIKCIQMFKMPDLMKESEKLTKWCVTADSKGLVKLWHVKVKKLEYTFELKAEIGTDCRITCLSVVPPVELKKEKSEADTSIEVVSENQNDNTDELDKSVAILEDGVEENKNNASQKITPNNSNKNNSNQNKKKEKKKKIKGKNKLQPVINHVEEETNNKPSGKKRKGSASESSSPKTKKKFQKKNKKLSKGVQPFRGIKNIT